MPRKCLKVPPLFFRHIFYCNISQLQALATGICSIQILILLRSTLFLGIPEIASQGTPGGVSRCPNMGYIETFFKIFFVKKCIVIWGDGEPLAPKIPVSDRWGL